MWRCSNFFSKMAEGYNRNSRHGQERSPHNERVTNAKELDSQKSKEKNTSMVPCGLINQGMTCYLNAVLQTLFMTDEFRDRVLSSSTSKSPEEKALADLFSLMQKSAAVSTEKITKALNITDVFEQQDAAEYLQMILHKIPEPSEIFRGIMVTSTVCSVCKHNNEEDTDFLSIPLSIDERGKRDVEHALMEYLGVHDMSGDDQLYCVKCSTMRNMETGNEIKKWPDILTLQLKRFEMCFIRNELYYWKNKCNVEIPPKIQVDSVKYESSPEYELYAIINHHGSFINGHYVTLAKYQSGNWYCFNDDRVIKMDNIGYTWITGCSKSAYLLMYRKVRKEIASSGQDDPQTHTSEGKRNNPQLKNPEEDHTSVKMEPPMTNPDSSKRRKSSVSESYSKMLKQRLKQEFQCLNKETLPGEEKLLNEIFIEPDITEENYSNISDKRQIMCNNIFKGQNIMTVLMKGEAGFGKTVTVQKFILDWAEEKSNHDIEYIFLIPFHKLNIIIETVKECSFMELLQRCCENTERLNPESRIMLILDGLNEFKVPLENTKNFTDLNEPASVSDLLTNLIMGNLLPNAQIWITSRPAAANQIPAGFIDRVTEIQGFNDEQKEEYFRKSISDPIMANKVISHIQKSPRINSMCYLPDYCRIIAAIPEKIISTGGSDFPKTLTQMYSKLLLAQTDPVPERRETIIALGKIAFDLLVNANSLFCDEDYELSAERVKASSSIIKVIDEKRKSFCFVNPRTQEFLAALYVTDVINGGNPVQLRDLSSLKLELGEQSFTHYDTLQKVMDIALQNQMDLFFCFLLGFRLESSQIALKDLLTPRSSSSSSQEIIRHIKTMIMNSSSDDAVESRLLLDCLKELDERYLIQEIKKQLKSGLRLSPEESSALMIKLLNSQEKLDDIKSHQSEELKLQPVVKTSGEHEFLRSCGISDGGCAVLRSALRSNPSHLRELDLSENNITESEMKQLSALLEHPQCKLEKLGLRSCGISDGGCADLSSSLRSNPSLRELDLSGNKIRDSGVKQLSALLEYPQCKLEKLELRSFNISNRGCAVLSSALRLNPTRLRELDLSENNFNELGVKILSDLLADPRCKLEKLGLRSCGISDGGCAVLSSALISNPSLRELDLSENNIRDSGVKQLSALLAHPQCKLQKLGLRSCDISCSGCYYLSSYLISNPSLRELDLSGNNITESGVMKVSDLLKHPQCKLEKLGLRSCGIRDGGCAVLRSALRSNPSLRELDLSENNITDSGIKQLSDLLADPRCKLEKLEIRSCYISNQGCADLRSALRSNPSHLRELDLSGNVITDSGIKQLSDLLDDPLCKLEKLGH